MTNHHQIMANRHQIMTNHHQIITNHYQIMTTHHQIMTNHKIMDNSTADRSHPAALVTSLGRGCGGKDGGGLTVAIAPRGGGREPR